MKLAPGDLVKYSPFKGKLTLALVVGRASHLGLTEVLFLPEWEFAWVKEKNLDLLSRPEVA